MRDRERERKLVTKTTMYSNNFKRACLNEERRRDVQRRDALQTQRLLEGMWMVSSLPFSPPEEEVKIQKVLWGCSCKKWKLLLLLLLSCCLIVVNPARIKKENITLGKENFEKRRRMDVYQNLFFSRGDEEIV